MLVIELVTGGLLHSVPKHEEEKDMPGQVTNALHECVTEKEPGGRVKAVNDLADLLAVFVRLR